MARSSSSSVPASGAEARPDDSRNTTDFRIDLPARSGHIEGDGRCWVGIAQNGIVGAR